MVRQGKQDRKDPVKTGRKHHIVISIDYNDDMKYED
jgi:hypothetical protein